MSTTEAVRAPVTAIPLPKAVILGEAAAETSPYGQLHDELRQERADQKYEEAIAAARSAVDGSLAINQLRAALDPGSPERGYTLNRGQTLFTEAGAKYPFERVIIKALGESVGAPDLVQQTRAMRRDDVLHFDSGQGYSLKASASTRGRADWRLILADQDPEARTASLDSFVQTFKASTEKNTTTQQELYDALNVDQPVAYSSATFEWVSEADDIMSIMGQADIHVSESDSPAMQRAKFIEALYALPAHYANETIPAGASRAGAYFDENGNLQKVLIPTMKPGVYYGLQSADPKLPGDLTEIPLHIGVEVHADETYSFNGDTRGIPFVETETAGQLLDSFAAAGLGLSDELRGIITETKITKLFGHGFATLTREIAKLVNDPQRGLDRLFQSANGDITGSIRELQQVNDPAARIVIDLLKGIVDRSAAPQDVPELAVSSHRINMRNGSCKDMEVYLANGNIQSADGTQFLRSKYSRPTVMTLEPTSLNGVLLPAGTLLAVEDDGYLMMRITAYGLDDDTASEAFGVQEAENRKHFYGAARSGIRYVMSRISTSA